MKYQSNTSLLSSESIKERKKAWLECLPSNLSNLFYYPHSEGNLERVSTYALKITEQDISKLKQGNEPLVAQAVSIEMGCDPNNKETFAPIFTFLFQKNISISFDLQLIEEDNSKQPIQYNYINKAESKGNQLTEITKSIGELFAQKWNELTDLEIGHAFSGVTYGKLPVTVDSQQQNMEKMRRVLSYRFPQEDAERIFDYIVNSKHVGPPIVHVMLGAGLVVRVNHPFNFRPIIFTGPTGQTESDKTGTFYERAKPCPPFCKD